MLGLPYTVKNGKAPNLELPSSSWTSLYSVLFSSFGFQIKLDIVLLSAFLKNNLTAPPQRAFAM